MKKRILPIVTTLWISMFYGQVGINSSNPNSTLDIVAKNSNGISTAKDGLLVPRIDRQRALNMASVEHSTLVYVSSIATGTATGQASNINDVGFYYFDGATSKWVKVIPEDLVPSNGLSKTNNNIELGGALTKNTSISGDYNLNITGGGDVGIGLSNTKAVLDVSSTNSGVRFPRLNNAQRDAMPTDRAHTATVIFNTDVSRLQVNVGTDANRVWANLDTSSSTLNSSVAYRKPIGSAQTITASSTSTANYVPITFQETMFNSVPSGIITKASNNNEFSLAGGKIYKIDVNMGRLESSDDQHTWCRIFNIDTDVSLSSVSILSARNTSVGWNDFNSLNTYVTVPAGQTRKLRVECAKNNSGTVTVNSGVPATITFSVMN